MTGATAPAAVVLGQVARDLLLLVDEMPEGGASTDVLVRREQLGGKGANQAVALTQLGVATGLVGVIGDDSVGAGLMRAAGADSIDTSGVVVRREAVTGLIVDVVDRGGAWRYLEHLPAEVLLQVSDVERARDLLKQARVAVLQLQQPSESVAAAAEIARTAGTSVVLDGVPPDDARRGTLLSLADVLRADEREAALLAERALGKPDEARSFAQQLLRQGPGIVVLALGKSGNLVAWEGGGVLWPLLGGPVVDTTGAGDAFVAGLVSSLLAGEPPDRAGRLATAAASVSVGILGGRPALERERLEAKLQELDERGPVRRW